jgi:anti-sigma factor RsiW
MDCALMQQNLIPYHFGEIDDQERLTLEAHLACCPRCLHHLFALKRSLETASAIPSAAAKARLRTAVAQTVERAQARARWSWWERPLAIGFATAAVALAAFATASLAASPGAAPHGWVASNQP